MAEVDSVGLTALRDGEEAVAEFARDGHDGAFSPAANLDSVVEAAHLRILADQDPGALHEDAANDRVALAGDVTVGIGNWGQSSIVLLPNLASSVRDWGQVYNI